MACKIIVKKEHFIREQMLYYKNGDIFRFLSFFWESYILYNKSKGLYKITRKRTQSIRGVYSAIIDKRDTIMSIQV